MKRIKIDDDLIQTVEKFNNNLFSDKKLTGGNAFISPKKKLKILYKTLTLDPQRLYIIKLFREYQNLLNLKPSEFAQKKQEFDVIYAIDGIDKSASTEFGKKVVSALRYDAYRESQYSKIINDLGWNLKACFYCNYVGTLTVKKDIKYKSYYDLDHVMPKYIYPFLATSFFNFIPSCSPCNRSKSKQIIIGLNPFYEVGEVNVNLSRIFKITNKSKAQFYSNFDKDKIEIDVSNNINNIDKAEFNKIVDLKILYSTQKQEAEEILWKKKIYSKAYINFIQSNFSKLYLRKYEINRILWGTDLNEDNVNDRPLAKFKFDLINDK